MERWEEKNNKNTKIKLKQKEGTGPCTYSSDIINHAFDNFFLFRSFLTVFQILKKGQPAITKIQNRGIFTIERWEKYDEINK